MDPLIVPSGTREEGAMRRSRIFILALIPLAFWLPASSQPDYPFLPRISEILPQPADGEAPAIELHNPDGREVAAAGLKLVINGSFEYTLPEDLPPVPPGRFVVIKLDGRGAAGNDYDYGGGAAILHAPPDLDRALAREEDPDMGQVELYRADDPEAPELVGFVAWGGPASMASRTVERVRLWPIGQFVSRSENFGLHTPTVPVHEAYSVGILPMSRTARVQDWVVYAADEITLGTANAVPSPKAFTAPDGTVFRRGDLAIGWTGNPYAREYLFELARDQGFSAVVDRKVLDDQLYRPSEPLPEGDFYYRVRTIDQDGGQSGWSQTRTFGIKAMSYTQDEPGECVDEKRVVQTADYRRQRKDTKLLCLDGCGSESVSPTGLIWDGIHPDEVSSSGEHGDENCTRACISMVASHFGQRLSQDRIAYYEWEGSGRPNRADLTPDKDLAHFIDVPYYDVELLLKWSLGQPPGRSPDKYPSFTEIRGWLDDDRPILTATAVHMRVLSGYCVDADEVEWVQLMDPETGPPEGLYVTYDSWKEGSYHELWLAPTNAPGARTDEASVWSDTDGDGVMDFDEKRRFATNRFARDSDNDGVADKNDIREYVFDAEDSYVPRPADLDADTLRKEVDPDNDHDAFRDGCEDANGNGKRDPGEAGNNFDDTTTGLSCPEKPVHCVIVFDRSGSMRLPETDPKYDRAVDAAALFIDTWMLNAPIPGTKLGVVFYDHSAYFDEAATSDSSLQDLNEAVRARFITAFEKNRPGNGSTSIGGGILEAMDGPGFDVNQVPDDEQRRVLVVLTDGKENSGPYMTSFEVLQGLVKGQVSGYVLGIGDEPQIDAEKLDALADILGQHSASFATDLDEGDLEKFYLQALAETRGIDFAVDPSGTLVFGEPQDVTVPVSQGTRRATFAVAWNDPNASLDFTLSDPDGNPVAATASRSGCRYRVATADDPAPGNWTLTLSAAASGNTAITRPIRYNVMTLENNDEIAARFEVRGGYQLNEPMMLLAELMHSGQRYEGATVKVDVRRPSMALHKFLSTVPVDPGIRSQRVERNVRPSRQDDVAAVMAMRGIERPTERETIWLNDAGKEGDAIPGDGRYTGRFSNTSIGGVYTFRFIAESDPAVPGGPLRREKLITVLVSPRSQRQAKKPGAP
jgi:hypothetical protein